MSSVDATEDRKYGRRLIKATYSLCELLADVYHPDQYEGDLKADARFLWTSLALLRALPKGMICTAISRYFCTYTAQIEERDEEFMVSGDAESEAKKHADDDGGAKRIAAMVKLIRRLWQTDATTKEVKAEIWDSLNSVLHYSLLYTSIKAD